LPWPSSVSYRFFAIYFLTCLPALFVALTDEIFDRTRLFVRAFYCAFVGLLFTPLPLIALVAYRQPIWGPPIWYVYFLSLAGALAALACSFFFARYVSSGRYGGRTAN
jgi:uncharacterized membrane protein YdjX (TVP38/TMEM64 family)